MKAGKYLGILVLAIVLMLLQSVAFAGSNLGNIGTFHKWHKVEIILTGPYSSSVGNFNPFSTLVTVSFSGPGGNFTVPAFYDGDGNGNGTGNVWKVRFCPNATGTWTFSSTSSDGMLNGYTGTFSVDDAPASAPKLLREGRLEYVGGHYLKFEDGGYWIKAGVDDPENFLGTPFGSFDNKKAAIDYLASKGVNSVYVMLNTITPGDGNDTWPWLGATSTDAKANSSRYDVGKLLQWEDFFSYCESSGIVLHIIFDDDSAWHSYDHSLYYREMTARFGHHPGLIWNVGEEANEDYTDSQIIANAALIRSWDAYDHPLTVHRQSSVGSNWPFIGNVNFDLTSIQAGSGGDDLSTATLPDLNAIVRQNRAASDAAGRPIAVNIDEIARVTQVNDAMRFKLRSQVFYAIFLGGGGHELHYQDQWTQGGTLTYQALSPMFDDMRIAREFMEGLPFNDMTANNGLLSSVTGNFCLAKPGLAYGIYLKNGDTVSLNLTGVTGAYQVKWYNVKTGESIDGPTLMGGDWRSLGIPAYSGDVACKVVRGVTYPGTNWGTIDPSSLGMDNSKLQAFANSVGGSGVIIKDGFIVCSWGSPEKSVDWASASKPTITTCLFFALAEGLTTMDKTIYPDYWPNAIGKDRGITFRYLSNMLSGYMRPEAPGAAFSYNDYNINLYTHTLYDKVYHSDPQTVLMSKFAPLGLQDFPRWDTGDQYGRQQASPRDFARIGWLWVNKGAWGSAQLIPSTLFDQYCVIGVSPEIPVSVGPDSPDYLGVGSMGGGTNQTNQGPGHYGFCWWFNNGWWPDAPPDTYEASGHAGDEVMAVIPSLGIVASSDGWWGGPPGDTGMNDNLKLLKESIVTPGVPDTTPPTAPYGIECAVLSDTMVQITWEKSLDNVAVQGYKIYRDGVVIGTTSGQSFTDTGLKKLHVYKYALTAYDFAGNESAKSGTVQVMIQTGDTEAPTVPGNVRASAGSPSSIAVIWDASTDDAAVKGYKVFRGGVQIADTSGTSWIDDGLQPNTTYSYTVSAYDASGNESAQSSPVQVTTPTDTQAPSVPTGVQITQILSREISLAWNPSVDDGYVAGYKIYRNGVQTGVSATTSYADSGLQPGTAYSYTISAYDTGNNESAQSSPPATGTTKASDFCSVDLGTTDVNNLLSRVDYSDGNTAALTSGGLDCRKTADSSDSYIYFSVDDSFLYNLDVTLYLEVTYYDSQSSSYFIQPEYDSAYDSDEHETGGRYKQAAAVYMTGVRKWKTAVWELDRCKFANRQNGGADFRLNVGTAANISIDSVRISTIPYSEHEKVMRDLGANEVYAGLSNPATSGGNTIVVDYAGRSCRRCLATGDVNFYFSVSDGVMYNGNPSTVYLKVTYYDSPGGLITPQYDSTSGAYTNATTLNFTGTNTWKDAIWTLNNVKFADSETLGCDFRLNVGTLQNVYIDKVEVSKDSFGDIEAPSIPTGLQGEADSTTQISLTWTASTDNIGVTGYKIYRDGIEIDSSGTTSYMDNGLTPDTIYTYKVSAYDAAGNESGQSDPVSVRTLKEITIGEAKQLSDNIKVALASKVVTAIFDDCIYIEESDKSSGIKVKLDQMPVGLNVGDSVYVIGVLHTDVDERYISGSIQ